MAPTCWAENHQAEDGAPFDAGTGLFGQDGVDRRIDAGEEEADGELAGRKGVQCVRDGLDEEEDPRQDQGQAQGLDETVMLAEAPPERCRNGTGKTA
mgnify:CR=1 FL=1